MFFSDEIFNVIIQNLNSENWVKFSSDLQLADLEEGNPNENDNIDFDSLCCFLKDKWLENKDSLSDDKINGLKDAVKKINKESILESEEFQTLLSSG